MAMAFAMASGYCASVGLVTAIVAGFLVSLFGGSSVRSAGRPGAFVVVYGIVGRHGVSWTAAVHADGGPAAFS